MSRHSPATRQWRSMPRRRVSAGSPEPLPPWDPQMGQDVASRPRRTISSRGLCVGGGGVIPLPSAVL